MQVMQTSELSKTEVLVGQAQQTQNFSVSDDPMLMSMLSTGFYGNPLRTMIQEVMFNAWDAHRMGNCLDRPIDIYVNKESGLIIRDYGPGIADEDMHSVYCVYGGSTKRKDKRLTGGFGLGSKSPFAYAESFTVTSMNDGTRSLYLISRVSEDGGKPGMTRLMQNPVINDSGLMVTVNLEEGDHVTVYSHIQDILFLSGVKARVHYFDEEPELYESKALAAGEYHADIENTKNRARGIYAVYGGVRYQIPRHKDYEEEYSALYSLCNNSCLYIGFAPDTLTPLPNREGLNMSEKSREAVKAGFELCLERFRDAVEPLVKTYMRHMFKLLVEDGIQPQFALNSCFGFHNAHYHYDEREAFIKAASGACPEGVLPNIWDLGLQILKKYPAALVEATGKDRWANLLYGFFCEAYPDHRSMAFAVKKAEPIYGSGTSLEHQIVKAFMPSFYRDLYEFERELAAKFPKDDMLRATIYVDAYDIWTKANHEEVRTKEIWEKNKRVTKKSEPVIHKDRLFFVKSGDEVKHLFMTKTIFLAKTVGALRDSNFHWGKFFSKKLRNTQNYGNINGTKVLGCVVHARNGAYDEAVAILKARGWNVIEADEPEKKTRTSGPSQPTVPMYRLLDVKNSTWANQGENAEIPDPTHYFYMTLGDMGSYYSYAKPDTALVYRICEKFPKMVMVHHQLSVNALEKRGVKTFKDAVNEWFNTMVHKKYRFRNMVRAMKIQQLGDIPSEMLQGSTLVQKTFGMVPVDEADKETFWREVKDYNLILENRYQPLHPITKEAINQVQTVWNTDPMQRKLCQVAAKSKVFNSYALKSEWTSIKDKDRTEFEESVARFLRAN